MTFAKEAWPFVLPFVAASGVTVVFGRAGLGTVLAVLGLLVLLFFRIPSRASEADETVVLAPANGTITKVGSVRDPDFAAGEYHHIVTFLSVFNIHVQRAPVTGEVITSSFRPGRKVAAFRADAGDVNESHLTVLELDGGETVAVKQIAGLLARRVVSHVDVGDRVARGELIGLIKFGSRVDLYVPGSYRVLVEEGQTVREGDTAVAIDGMEDAA